MRAYETFIPSGFPLNHAFLTLSINRSSPLLPQIVSHLIVFGPQFVPWYMVRFGFDELDQVPPCAVLHDLRPALKFAIFVGKVGIYKPPVRQSSVDSLIYIGSIRNRGWPSHNFKAPINSPFHAIILPLVSDPFEGRSSPEGSCQKCQFEADFESVVSSEKPFLRMILKVLG